MKTLTRCLAGLGLTGWLVLPVMAGVTGEGEQVQTNAATAEPTAAATTDSALAPDGRRLLALAMIETGTNDREIGGDGEVSRYQLSRAVWKSYTTSQDYTDPEVSLQVAWQHWSYLANYFKQKTGREPNDFDMYVLWNTRFGYYAHKGFSQHEISPVVQDRAQRFVNLVNRKA
jgi:hypothetical protein